MFTRFTKAAQASPPLNEILSQKLDNNPMLATAVQNHLKNGTVLKDIASPRMLHYPKDMKTHVDSRDEKRHETAAYQENLAIQIASLLKQIDPEIDPNIDRKTMQDLLRNKTAGQVMQRIQHSQPRI